jgi:hypothetical protein
MSKSSERNFRVVELRPERGGEADGWHESRRATCGEALEYFLQVHRDALLRGFAAGGPAGLRRDLAEAATNTGLIVRGSEVVAVVTFLVRTGQLVAMIVDRKTNRRQTRHVPTPAAA